MSGRSALALITALVLLITRLEHVHAQDAAREPCAEARVPGHDLSLADAVRIALCASTQIRAAAAAIELRSAQRGQVRSQYWPQLTAAATQMREHTEYRGDSAPDNADSGTTFYGSLSWRLFDFGERRAESFAAAQMIEAALKTRDATVQRVLRNVAETYFAAVTARALRASAIESEGVAEETLASARRRVESGTGSQADILQATTALARAALDLNRARAGYEKAIATLTFATGLPAGITFDVPTEVDASGTSNEKSLDAWLAEAERAHPAIAAARADVQAARAKIASARASGKPAVHLQTNYYGNGFPQEGLTNGLQASTTAGISITVPVFDGFLTRYRVREAEAALDMKEEELVGQQRHTLTEIVQAYADASSAAANLRESETLLEAAESSQSSSRRRYANGAADILELLAAQSALADARRERVRCLAEWRSAGFALVAASGQLSPSSLQ
jgi:outer membrane protein